MVLNGRLVRKVNLHVFFQLFISLPFFQTPWLYLFHWLAVVPTLPSKLLFRLFQLIISLEESRLLHLSLWILLSLLLLEGLMGCSLLLDLLLEHVEVAVAFLNVGFLILPQLLLNSCLLVSLPWAKSFLLLGLLLLLFCSFLFLLGGVLFLQRAFFKLV